MAMRLLVCICCIATSSATGVWSESQFKSKYDAHVKAMDSAQVKIANAEIVGEAIPAGQPEREMHRWYQDVNAAVKADAKAIMDKTVADALGNYPTADCMTKIGTASKNNVGTWQTLYPIYLSVSGDVVQADAAAATAQVAATAATKAVAQAAGAAAIAAANKVKTTATAAAATASAAAIACQCVHALSGAEKDLAIKAGFHSKLFDLFQRGMTAALTAPVSMATVSTFVTGTLGTSLPGSAPEGQLTQPMYSAADATLRVSMMRAMVSELNGQLPVV